MDFDVNSNDADDGTDPGLLGAYPGIHINTDNVTDPGLLGAYPIDNATDPGLLGAHPGIHINADNATDPTLASTLSPELEALWESYTNSYDDTSGPELSLNCWTNVVHGLPSRSQEDKAQEKKLHPTLLI